MSQRPVYEKITSPYYKRFFVPTSCFGDKTRGILLYRETGSDEWVINYNATYYTADLKAAKNNTSSGFQYLGLLDFDSLFVSCMAEALMKLETTAKGDPTLCLIQIPQKNIGRLPTLTGMVAVAIRS